MNPEDAKDLVQRFVSRMERDASAFMQPHYLKAMHVEAYTVGALSLALEIALVDGPKALQRRIEECLAKPERTKTT